MILCCGETGGKSRGNVCTGSGWSCFRDGRIGSIGLERGRNARGRPCVLGKVGPENGPVLREWKREILAGARRNTAKVLLCALEQAPPVEYGRELASLPALARTGDSRALYTGS